MHLCLSLYDQVKFTNVPKPNTQREIQVLTTLLEDCQWILLPVVTPSERGSVEQWSSMHDHGVAEHQEQLDYVK